MFVHLISQGAPLQMVSTKCLVVSAVCRRYHTLRTHIGHCTGTNLSGPQRKRGPPPNTRATFRDVWPRQRVINIKHRSLLATKVLLFNLPSPLSSEVHRGSGSILRPQNPCRRRGISMSVTPSGTSPEDVGRHRRPANASDLA